MDILLFIGTMGVFVFLLLSIDSKVSRLQGQLTSMQRRLDQLTEAAGIPEPEINDQLRAMIRDGKKVAAVKLARETFGFSLLEGKQYVDKLEKDVLE